MKKKNALSLTVIIGIAVLLIIFEVAANIIGYYQFTKIMTAEYQENAIAIANESASIVDIELIDEYLATGNYSEEYSEMESRIQNICDNMVTEFIYIIEPDTTDYLHIKFVLNAQNKKSTFTKYDIGYIRETTNEDYRQKYEDLYNKNRENAIVVRDKGYIETDSHITALVPLHDSDGNVRGLLAVQKQMEYLSQGRLGYLKGIAISSLILIVLSIISSYSFFKRRLLKPIKTISNEAERFSNEYTIEDKSLSDRIKYHDELGSLALTIDKMEKETLEYFAAINKIKEEKARVNTELNLASNIQTSMLPHKFPKREDFNIYATMNPAKEIGGDFYDFFMVDDKHVAIVIADVSGKGIPAALFMGGTKLLIKNHMQLGISPAETFTNVNKMLCESNDAGLFVTAWLGLLDITSGKLIYVNAGHNPPLIKQDDIGFKELNCKPGFVLAGLNTTKYTQYEITLNANDRIFLYTDGVTEATNGHKELYGIGRLITYLNNHKEDTLREVLFGLKQDVDTFSGDEDQADDLTMLILSYKDQTGNNIVENSFEAKTENLPNVISFVEKELKKGNCPENIISKIDISLEEMFINIVNYAYPNKDGNVNIRISVKQDKAIIYLEDTGITFNPLAKEDPDITLDANERQVGGMGIYMVKELMDKVDYEYVNNKNIFTMIKYF